MSNFYTRRDFLALSALGLAAAGARTTAVFAQPAAGKAPTPALAESEVWVTSNDRRLQRASSLTWLPASGSPGGQVIVLSPQKKYQEILGFGGAFTDAACYNFSQLSPSAREKLFHQLFHPSEMGLNVCRTCIGSSDYSRTAYSYDDGDADPDLKRFSIDHDRTYILPTLREARAVNPDLFLFSSPWSPPGWMKANGSILGGSMERRHMASYANYFLKFLQDYEAAGVPVQAMTIQNEVDTGQDGRMPACIWPQEYEADFVANNLGPLFAQHGVKTKIWLIDHNYNLWGRAIDELETPGVRKYANAIAWHGYLGEPEWMSRVHEAYPDVQMYWTEGGPDYTDPNYGSDWTKWSTTFAGIFRNWCCSVTGWNLALDEHGKPNIGPFSCGGLVTINSQSKEISYSGQYWALAHYSRFLRRGCRHFDSQGGPAGINHVAFENPDGSRVMVLTNEGVAKRCTVRSSDKNAVMSLESNSVTTLVWR
jgi:glucosylceramidase